MSEKIMQCCYSNIISGTGTGGGWQVTAASGELPAVIREEYARIQDSNVTSQEPKDAQGNPLNMYEIVIRKEYLFLTRVAYGLKDNSGRHNNMLSHSYLFRLDEELLSDPNIFLTVEDSNFTDDIEKAGRIPDTLKRSVPCTLEAALKQCGLDEETYVRLIYAMHARRENNRTLYLHSCRGEEIIRPAVYCIWMGLPLAYRRTFSCAGAVVNRNSSRMIVFSRDHDPSEFYFDLDTGESNILDTRSVRKYRRWGFADYFPENYKQIDGEQYFKDLEDTAVRLGDSKGAKPKILKIAHQILTGEDGETDDGELQRRLLEALLAPVEPNPYMDAYTCSVLKKINRSGRLLDSETAEEALLNRMKENVLPALREEGEIYLLRKITSLSPQDGSYLLSQLSGEQFERLCGKIQQMEHGPDYMDEYYKTHFPEQISWEVLEDFLADVDEHCETIYPETKKKLDAAVRDLYVRDLKCGVSPEKASRQYIRFGSMISLTAEEEEMLPRTAGKLYWDQFSLEAFSWKKMEEYEFFRMESHPVGGCVQLLCSVLRGLKQEPAREVTGKMDLLLSRYRELLTREIRRKLYEEMADYMEAGRVPDRNLYVNLFYLMMALGSVSFQQQYRDYAELILAGDTEAFIESYNRNAEEFELADEKEKVLRIYHIFLFRYLKQKGALARVNLDVLLTVGKTMYENPFEILDNLSLFSSRLYDLLDEAPEETAADSVLLGTEEFLDFAGEYIRGDSGYRQIVKEWAAEARKQLRTRKSRRSGEHDGIPGLGGFLNKIRPGRK